MTRTIRELEGIIAGLKARLSAVRERVARGEHDNGQIRAIMGDLNAATTELKHAQPAPNSAAAASMLSPETSTLASKGAFVAEPAPQPAPETFAPAKVPAETPAETLAETPAETAPKPVYEAAEPAEALKAPKVKKKEREPELSLDEKLQALSDRLRKHRMMYGSGAGGAGGPGGPGGPAVPFTEPGVMDLARNRMGGALASAAASAPSAASAAPGAVPTAARVPLRKSFIV